MTNALQRGIAAICVLMSGCVGPITDEQAKAVAANCAALGMAVRIKNTAAISHAECVPIKVTK